MSLLPRLVFLICRPILYLGLHFSFWSSPSFSWMLVKSVMTGPSTISLPHSSFTLILPFLLLAPPYLWNSRFLYLTYKPLHNRNESVSFLAASLATCILWEKSLSIGQHSVDGLLMVHQLFKISACCPTTWRVPPP